MFYSDLTEAQRQAMDAYTPAKIAAMSAKKLAELPVLYEGHMSDYKIVTRDRIVAVMRLGPDDGYFGPKVIHNRLMAGRWVDCDKHGNPTGRYGD